MASYKKQYGITLKDGKLLALAKYNRLPDPGREFYLFTHKIDILWDHDKSIHDHYQKVYLINHGGKLSITGYTSALSCVEFDRIFKR